jgi:hypothetical protein
MNIFKHHFKHPRLILLLLGILLSHISIPPYLKAADVTLAWDANTESDLAGYKIYYGNITGSYNTSINVGNVTTYRITGLLSNSTYYFVATAYNTSNLESAYSNEVSTVTLSIVPIINFLTASSILTTEATIVWTTSSECSGIALYGLISNQLFAVTSNNLGTTDHLSRITGLKPRTHYIYKVQSTCGGQQIESEIRSFNTK